MPFVDFAELKTRVSIEQAVQMLGVALARQGAQHRGPCPACKSGGDRTLVVTPAKGLFYCFGGKIGGDAIALVAHVRQVSAKEAADELASTFGTVQNGTITSNSTVRKDRATAPPAPAARSQPAFDPEAYASRLDVAHASLATLGLSPKTLKDWKAGYSPSGTNRGRLAVALHDPDGNVLGFAGRALGNEQPRLLIPNGVNPADVIFGGYRTEQGPLYLVRDILDVLRAYESGVTNCVCFLTEISGLQTEMLAALMAAKRAEPLELS